VSAPSQLGRYRLLEVLGEAVIGTLYRGHHDVIDRDVWVKVLAGDQGRDTVYRLYREAQVTAKLNHQNVITALDVGEESGTHYLVFEGLEGRSLRLALAAGISLGASVPVILQVLDGLAYAHAAGVVHRDIKPENIFICTDGLVKITNFELARVIPSSSLVPGVITGAIIGTPEDMPPEQVMGARVDGRSDLFSVGCTLYECIVGGPPFPSDSVLETFYKIVHLEPEMDSIPGGAEWTGLRRVILRALQKRPEDRYPDAQSMSTDLRSALGELGESASWTTRAPSVHRRSVILSSIDPGRPNG
jgi:serine/threonine-protein kinase